MKLAGKVAVITGGNSGIGLGIAQVFKEEGARGAIVGRNLETLAAAAQQLGNDFLVLQGDVTQLADLERVFQATADKFGKIDVLIVNAGGSIGKGMSATVEDATEDDFQRAIDTNLKSVLFTVQKALPHLRDGASVVLIGSDSAHRAFAGLTIYSAAKAGVISFARSFSQTLLPRRIRVNVLSPCATDTPAFDKFGLPPEQVAQVRASFADTLPVGRIAQPRDMGRVAAFMASDDSAFLLGTEVLADGGSINL